MPPTVASPQGERRYLAHVGFDAHARIRKEVELSLGEPENAPEGPPSTAGP